jgi:hypothetical protein
LRLVAARGASAVRLRDVADAIAGKLMDAATALLSGGG